MFDLYSLMVPFFVLAVAVLLIKKQWDAFRIESASPDALRFDLESGDLISAGHRVSRLLGYPHSEQCLGQYHAHVHLINGSLKQLASGRMMANSLVLQDRNGLPLSQALRVRSDHKGRYLDLSITDQSERRQLERSPPVHFQQRLLAQPEARAQSKSLSALLALFEGTSKDDGQFYAVHDQVTGRLFVTQSLLARMGLASRDRWLSEQIWSQCLSGRNWTPMGETRVDLAECGPRISVVTMRGEDLLFDLDLLPLPYDDLFRQRGELAFSEASQTASLNTSPLNESMTEEDAPVHEDASSASAIDSRVVAEHRYQWLRLSRYKRTSASGAHDLEPLAQPVFTDEGRAETLTPMQKDRSYSGAETDDYSQLKMLVVEDDGLVRQAIRPAIEQLGVAFSMAKTLPEGLRHLSAEGPYDVVLTDLNLGVATSRPLIERVHRESPQTTVLLMTASQVELEGVHQVVSKPFSLEHLRMTVEWGLMRSKIERPNQENVRV